MQRTKWTVDEPELSLRSEIVSTHLPLQFLAALIEKRALTTHFQPLFSARDGSIYGYEALARPAPGVQAPDGQPLDIGRLFRDAAHYGLLSSLDFVCSEIALRQAARLGLAEMDVVLFVNICPVVLTDPNQQIGHIKERIIFELTEEVAVQDYPLFCLAVAYYRERGYKIAIDDFGVGYGGLKMLSMIEPNFVKIDRHFVSNIDLALVRYNLVDMIATACHRMGIQVVAEGVERPEELKILLNMGIGLFQGFYLAPPAANLYRESAPAIAVQGNRVRSFASPPSELKFIGQIATYNEPARPSAKVSELFKHFTDEPTLMSVPLVEGERVVGVLQRYRFLENDFVGRFGYNHLLNSTKSAVELPSSQHFYAFEANCTLEEVAQRISTRQADTVYDDICITQNGKYFGIVAVNVLLEALTRRSLLLAQGANPLTKLPGNEFIQREIETHLTQNIHFDVSYVDLDHFKPYNDHYGFERGDEVIRTVSQLIQECVLKLGNETFDFVGHIGGDDFIIVCRPQNSIAIAQLLCTEFLARVPAFHGSDTAAGNYISKNRRGVDEEFPLLSLSIAVVSTEVNNISSYAQLASIAAEIKKAAKAEPGNSIVRDRRLLEMAPEGRSHVQLDL
jgi:EAL domain-containing protein (putative c-di-GMP-specific phosphodiesterase class I)/GGDEF domain-containing protein